MSADLFVFPLIAQPGLVDRIAREMAGMTPDRAHNHLVVILERLQDTLDAQGHLQARVDEALLALAHAVRERLESRSGAA